MVVLNDLDRFHLVMDAIERVPGCEPGGAHVKQAMRERLIAHKHYIAEHGDDTPDVRDWKWPY
jgi:xylulose-5-phosphate/fructose-6-phosphate phosphoketolase